MLPIYDIKGAKESILKRAPFDKSDYPQTLLDQLSEIFGPGTTPEIAVSIILESIRENGDQALSHWSKILDHSNLHRFQITPEQLKKSVRTIDTELLDALKFAASRIKDFHQRQPLPNWTTSEMGGSLGQRTSPIEVVGIYVPGGSAPLPSSLLMSVIPAQVAGVTRVIVATPPNPHPTILAAASLCEVEEIYQVGGAQAIAALAYGTETIPKVDKIFGAGNLFVTMAKKQVYGQVGLDGLFGPTETMIIADCSANPAWLAADLLAQAEHDILATAILLTPDRSLADAVQLEVDRQLPKLSRSSILDVSLSNQSGIVIVQDLETAAKLANEYGAEHLCLAVDDPKSLSEIIHNAGGFFLGDHSFEVLGDYVAGPSHIMPTGGTARFNSPLNVLDFVKISSIVALDPQTAAKLAPVAARIAQAESLTAHAEAANFRC